MQPGWAGSSALGIRATPKEDSAVSSAKEVFGFIALWHSFKKFDYLSEIETESENTLACLSGGLDGYESWKKWRSKISWHTPFKGRMNATYMGHTSSADLDTS